MSFLTTNPSPFLVNIPELTNVVTNASGQAANLQNSVDNILTYLDTTTGILSVNTITTNSGTTVNMLNTLNLSNVPLQINGSNTLTSNSISGTPYLAFQVAGVEFARLATNAFGINTTTPAAFLHVNGNSILQSNVAIGKTSAVAPLDVNGSAVIGGALYVSSFGVPAVAPLGDIYADGDVYARGNFYPSDPSLKTNITPYKVSRLPDPVSFDWIKSGARDIGVLATDIEEIEPACVKTRDGIKTVDYAKLSVLCLAEIKALKERVHELEKASRPTNI